MIERLSRLVLLGASCLALGAAAQAGARSRDDSLRIEVGPIWNQQDAKTKCDKAARKAGGTWSGDWTTVIPGQSSVCMVRKGVSPGSSLRWPEPMKPAGAPSSAPKVEKLASGKWSVEAGPIHAQMEAQMKCPRATASVGGKWTGEWWTTQMGRMSVCEFTR